MKKRTKNLAAIVCLSFVMMIGFQNFSLDNAFDPADVPLDGHDRLDWGMYNDWGMLNFDGDTSGGNLVESGLAENGEIIVVGQTAEGSPLYSTAIHNSYTNISISSVDSQYSGDAAAPSDQEIVVVAQKKRETCADPSENTKLNSSFASDKFQNADVVLLGETHHTVDDAYADFFKRLQGSSQNSRTCIAVELPDNASSENFEATWPVDKWKSAGYPVSFIDGAYHYYESEAAGSWGNVAATDLSQVNNRDALMANAINSIKATGKCDVVVAVVGQGHIDNRVFARALEKQGMDYQSALQYATDYRFNLAEQLSTYWSHLRVAKSFLGSHAVVCNYLPSKASP